MVLLLSANQGSPQIYINSGRGSASPTFVETTKLYPLRIYEIARPPGCRTGLTDVGQASLSAGCRTSRDDKLVRVRACPDRVKCWLGSCPDSTTTPEGVGASPTRHDNLTSKAPSSSSVRNRLQVIVASDYFTTLYIRKRKNRSGQLETS